MALKLARTPDLQEALKRLHDAGVLSTAVEVTGVHDQATSDALREFQKIEGLPEDGKARIRTRTRLQQSLRRLAKLPKQPVKAVKAKADASPADAAPARLAAGARRRRRPLRGKRELDEAAALLNKPPLAKPPEFEPAAGKEVVPGDAPALENRGVATPDEKPSARVAPARLRRLRRQAKRELEGARPVSRRGRRAAIERRAAERAAEERAAAERAARRAAAGKGGPAGAVAPAGAGAPAVEAGEAAGTAGTRAERRAARRKQGEIAPRRRDARKDAEEPKAKPAGRDVPGRSRNKGFAKKPTLVKLHPEAGDSFEMVRSARNILKTFKLPVARIEIIEGEWTFYEHPRTDPRFPGVFVGPLRAGVHKVDPDSLPLAVWGSAHNFGEGKPWFVAKGLELIPASSEKDVRPTRQVFASQETLEGLVEGKLDSIRIHEGEWILYEHPRQHADFPGEVYGPFGPGVYSVEDGAFGAAVGSLQQINKDGPRTDKQVADDQPWHLTFRPATIYFGKTRVDLDSSVEDLAHLGLQGSVSKLVVRAGNWQFFQFPKAEDTFPGQVYGPYGPGTHKGLGSVRSCQKEGDGPDWAQEAKPGATDPAKDALKTHEQKMAKQALKDALNRPGVRVSFERLKPFFKGLQTNRMQDRRVGKTHKGKADLEVREAFFGLAGRFVDDKENRSYSYIRFQDLEKLSDTSKLTLRKKLQDSTYKQLGPDQQRLRVGDTLCLLVKTRGPLKSIHLLNTVLNEKHKIPLGLQLTRLKVGDQTWTGGPKSPYFSNFNFTPFEGGDLWGEPSRELDRHDYWMMEWSLTDDPDRQRIVNALIQELKGKGSERQPPPPRRIPPQQFGAAPQVDDPEVAAQDKDKAPELEKQAEKDSAQAAGVPLEDLAVQAPAFVQFRWHEGNGGLSQRTEQAVAKIAALLKNEELYSYTLKPVNAQGSAERLKQLLVSKGLPAERLKLLPRAERPGVGRFELRREGPPPQEKRKLKQLAQFQEGLLRLVELGLLKARVKADGVDNEDNQNAIKAFQKAFGLKADGRAGPRTQRRLQRLLELLKDKEPEEQDPETEAEAEAAAAKRDAQGKPAGKAGIEGFVPHEVEKPNPKRVNGPKAWEYSWALARETLRERASDWARFVVGSVVAWRLGRELPDYSRFVGERLQLLADGSKREHIGDADGCRHGKGPHDRYTGFESQTKGVSRKLGRICRFCGAAEKVQPVTCLFCGKPSFVPRGGEKPPEWRAGQCSCPGGRLGLADAFAALLPLAELDDERPSRLGPLWGGLLSQAALLASFGAAGEVLPADLRPTRALLAKVAGGANLEKALARRHATGKIETLGPDGKVALPRQIYLNASPFAPEHHLERKHLLGKRGPNATSAVWSWAKHLGSWDKPAPEDALEGRLTRAELLRLGFLCQLLDAPLSKPEALAKQAKKSPEGAPGDLGWLEQENLELQFEVAIVQTDTGEHWPDPEQRGRSAETKLARGERDECFAAALALQLANTAANSGALLRNSLGERFLKLPAAYVYRDQWRARLDRLAALPLVKEDWVQPKLFDAQVPEVLSAHERAAEAVEKLMSQPLYFGPGYAELKGGKWSFPPQRFRHGRKQQDLEAGCLTDLTLMHYFLTHVFSKEKDYSPYLGPGEDLPARVQERQHMSRIQLLLGKRFGFRQYLEEVFRSATHETLLKHRDKLGGWAVALETFGRRRRLLVLTHFNGQLYRLSAFGGHTRRRGNDDKPLYYGGKVRFIPFEQDLSKLGIRKIEARYRVFALVEKYLKPVPEDQTLGNSDVAFIYSATTPGLEETDPSQPPRDPYELGRGRQIKPFHGLIRKGYQPVPVAPGPWQRLARGLLGILHCSLQSVIDADGKPRLEYKQGKPKLEGRKVYVHLEFDTLSDVEDTASAVLSRLSQCLKPLTPHETVVVLKGGSYHQRYLGWKGSDLSEFFYQGQAPAPKAWFYRHRKKPPVDSLIRFIEKQMQAKVQFYEYDRSAYKHGPRFRALGRRFLRVQPLRLGPPPKPSFQVDAEIISWRKDMPLENFAFRLLPGSKDVDGLTAGKVAESQTDLEYSAQRWRTGPKGQVQFRDLPPDTYFFSFEYLWVKDPRETAAALPRQGWEHGPHADDWQAPLETPDEDKEFRQRENDADVLSPRKRAVYGGRLEYTKDGKPVQFKKLRLLDAQGAALGPKLLEGGQTELKFAENFWKTGDNGEVVFVALPEGSYSLELDLSNERAQLITRLAAEIKVLRTAAHKAEAALKQVQTRERQLSLQGKEVLQQGGDPAAQFEEAASLRKKLPALTKNYNESLTKLEKAENEARAEGIDPDDIEALQQKAAAAEPTVLRFELKLVEEEWPPIAGVLAGHTGEPLVKLVPLASPLGSAASGIAAFVTERDGYVERTTVFEDGSKIYEQIAPDGTKVTEITQVGGMQARIVERADGSSTSEIKEPDGTRAIETKEPGEGARKLVVFEPDGTEITATAVGGELAEKVVRPGVAETDEGDVSKTTVLPDGTIVVETAHPNGMLVTDITPPDGRQIRMLEQPNQEPVIKITEPDGRLFIETGKGIQRVLEVVHPDGKRVKISRSGNSERKEETFWPDGTRKVRTVVAEPSLEIISRTTLPNGMVVGERLRADGSSLVELEGPGKRKHSTETLPDGSTITKGVEEDGTVFEERVDAEGVRTLKVEGEGGAFYEQAADGSVLSKTPLPDGSAVVEKADAQGNYSATLELAKTHEPPPSSPVRGVAPKQLSIVQGPDKSTTASVVHADGSEAHERIRGERRRLEVQRPDKSGFVRESDSRGIRRVTTKLPDGSEVTEYASAEGYTTVFKRDDLVLNLTEALSGRGKIDAQENGRQVIGWVKGSHGELRVQSLSPPAEAATLLRLDVVDGRVREAQA